MYRRIITFNFLLFISWASQTFAVMPPLANNTALDLGAFTCTQLIGDYNCNKVTDYSGMIYDSANRRMLMFGGGHATTMTDTIFALNLNSYPFTWSELYPPTLCSEMTPPNYDQATGAWKSGSRGPYPRPVARHTYDELAVVNGEFIILAFENGGQQLCPNGFDFSAGDPLQSSANVAHYNFASGTWTFSTTAYADGFPETGSNPLYGGSAYDPVSGHIYIVGRYGFWDYDPITKVKTRRIRGDWGEWKNNLGQTISTSAFGITPSLVYAPTTNKFYLFDWYNEFKIWELIPNKSSWLSTTITQMTIMGSAPICAVKQWAYDSVNQIIGGICGGSFYAFNPVTSTLTSQTIQGGTPGEVAYNAFDYDPGNNVFAFVTDTASGAKTWVYRYSDGPGTLPPAPSPDTSPPSTPTNFSASAISSSQINLSWSASSDNLAVIGYKIYRNGTQIITVTGASYQNTGLSPSTTYVYTVAAYDAAGNTSPQSGSASATTQAASTTPSPPAPSGCASEGGLSGRTDILHCEPWEDSNWWQNGYLENGSRTVYPALGPDSSEIVSSGCISGSCLKVTMHSWREGGAGGALAHHWPIPGNQEEVYLRYYLKLAPNFSPDIYSVGTGTAQGSGGKFPGLADVRAWPEPQCGNGGDFSDGINCWSARTKYYHCFNSSGFICQPNATTRFGHYWYLPPNTSPTNQVMGAWDTEPWGTADGPCSAVTGLGGWNNSSTSCGKGVAGLLNDRWYLMEFQIKMNTPGAANGTARGWIDGVLKYEKTNVEFRKLGHDNLHVRTVWLNVHAGGENVGPPETTAVYLDQMVVATGGRPGAWVSPTGGGSPQPPPAPSGFTLK